MDQLFIPEGLTDIKPIREIIYEHLRHAILNGLIRPGERLVERDIAVKFNASRTPVREALRKLETEGFVEYMARRGVVVRGFNIGQIDEIFSIRKELECLAIRSSIRNITDAQIAVLKTSVDRLEQEENGGDAEAAIKELHQFDDLIIDTANMPLLKSFLSILRESLQRYRKINLSNQPRRKEAVKEHRDLLQAIIDRDAERAEQLVCTHINNSRNELMRLMKV